MSRHDSQPPMDGWQPESRPCPCFERPDRIADDAEVQRIAAANAIRWRDTLELLAQHTPSIPANVVLGEE